MDENKLSFPCLRVDLDKLRSNMAALSMRCHCAALDIAAVVKGVTALPEVVRVPACGGAAFLASSRTEQLRAVRAMHTGVPTMLIRIPMLSELPEVVRFADCSLQSERSILRALNAECERQQKHHEVILMLDLGDLREGFFSRSELLAAALETERQLPWLTLAGIGTNLGCYGSVAATPDKMNELISAAETVERALGRRLRWISGGASTSVHMLFENTLPPRINLLRIGEMLLLGGIGDCFPAELHRDVFTLRAEVVECRRKPSYPIGELTADAFGRTQTYLDRGERLRVLCAVGRVDFGDPFDLTPRMTGVEILGASSDHLILDAENASEPIRVGDIMEFGVRYASLVYLTNTPDVRMEYHPQPTRRSPTGSPR